MKIALVGNQNSGKTTLFNLLTGSNQKVGNWPGVTIEQKSGILRETDHSIIDLPGIYSLSPYTPEEAVSREYIFNEKPDLIINIIDATSLERSLYLTTMLLELDTNVIIALNMQDILEKKGITIDVNKLSELLHTTIVSISALKRTGIDELINIVKEGNYITNIHNEIFSNDVEHTIKNVLKHIHMPHERFSGIKMLENDPKLALAHIREIEGYREELESHYEMDIEQIIADQRYKYIIKIKEECCTEVPVKESITKKLDKVLLNKYAAIPIFIGIMAIVYLLSVGLLGQYLSGWIDILFNGNKEGSFIGISNLLATAMKDGGASSWSISLVKNGIMAGVGSVLKFIPQIILLFFFISILETSGYMSRIAFFFDRIFHRFGLSGKSLIPFIVGTGCSVTGIMTTRIVEDDNEKRMTIALTPMMPCSAKLPVIAAFSALLFPGNGLLAFLVAFLSYVIAIVLILLYSLLIKKTVLKGDSTSFLSELPEYKLPDMKYVSRDVFEKTWEFIKRAGTIILVSSIIVWFLVSFTWTFQYVDGSTITINQSMLGGIGKAFEWLFFPMTGGVAEEKTWTIAVSAIQGLIAREQVVSSMEIIASSAGQSIQEYFSFFVSYPVVAIAVLMFILYSIPCIATVSTTRKETGSIVKTLKIITFQFVSAWVVSSLIGGIGVAISKSI